MSSTPESGDIHDVSHVVPFVSGHVGKGLLTVEELEAEALQDLSLQAALSKVSRRAIEIFGDVHRVSFEADPDIEARTYYVIEVPVRGTIEEIRALEKQWFDYLLTDDVREFVPRFGLSLNFLE